MITARQWRIKDGDKVECPTLTFNDQFKALAHLIDFELIWGGRIVKIEEVRFEVRTMVMNCLDITTLEGSVEEMHSLCKFACYYSAAEESHEDAIASAVARIMQNLASKVSISPAFLEDFTSRFPQRLRLRMATMLAYGITEQEDIYLGLETRIEDIIAAIELSREGLCSFREALAK